MYKEHKEFRLSAGTDIPIWRYMDFWKFESMITTGLLFFCRGALLSDSTEGDISGFEEDVDYLPFTSKKEEVFELIEKFSESAKRHLYVSCWNSGNELSNYMWNTFTKSGEGIAIKTDIRRFQKCFVNENRNIYIGNVKYVHNRYTGQPWTSIFSAYLIKESRYLPENEIRAIVRDNKVLSENPENDAGLDITVDLSILIEEIHLAPDASDEVKQKVVTLLVKNGLQNTPVIYN